MGSTEKIWVIATVGANDGDLDDTADGSIVMTKVGLLVVTADGIAEGDVDCK